MSPTIAFLIDDSAFAKGLNATTPLLGIPWLARSIRAAEMRGYRCVLLFSSGSPEQQETLLSALREHLPPRLRLPTANNVGTLWEESERVLIVPWNLLLDKRLLSDPDLLKAACAHKGGPASSRPFAITLRTRHDLRIAERRLLDDLRPSMAIDGIMGATFFRRISLQITRLLARYPITPNMVSIVVLLLGLASGIVASLGGVVSLAWGGALFLTAAVLDCCDGELARLKFLGSRFGAWLDTIVDDASTLVFLLGVGLNVAKAGGLVAFIAAMIGAGAYFVGLLFAYRKLARAGDSGNHTDLVWSPTQHPVVSTIFKKVSYLLKRDFFSVVFCLLALTNQGNALIWIASGGAVVFLLWTLADALLVFARHLRVRSARPHPQAPRQVLLPVRRTTTVS